MNDVNDDAVTVPLREYFEALREADQLAIAAALAGAEKAVAAALAAAEKAVLKAERAAELRFEGVNEFRQTLNDQALTFASKEKVDSIETRMNTLERTHIERLATAVEAINMTINRLADRVAVVESVTH